MPRSPAAPTDTLLSKPYVLLSLANFLMIAGVGCSLVYPLFLLHFGGTKSDIGILMGVMSLASVLCRPLISELIDRFGRSRCYMGGCLVMASVNFLHLFLQSPIDVTFMVLMGMRLLFGIGFALAMVAALTWASDLIPATRFNEGIGLFGAVGLMGMAVGPMVAEGIIYRFGFPAMFTSAGLIFTLTLLVSRWVNDTYLLAPVPARESFFQTLGNPRLLRITLIALCFGVGFAAHGSFVAPYARSLNLFAATYFLAYSAAAIAARLSIGRVADRIGETRLIPIALIFTGVGFTSLIWVHSPMGLCLSGLVTGTGQGVLFPSMLALAIRPFAAHNRGKANGVFTGGVDGGIFIGAVLLGYIGEHWGYCALFAMAGTALFTGLALFWTSSRSAFCPVTKTQ